MKGHNVLPHRFAVEDPEFLRCMGQLLGPGILPGNRVTALQNGDQIFPAMLDAIRGARETITFETYIYWSGDIGRKFSEAFCERAQAGVTIHVMLDWVGCDKSEVKYQDDMKAAGVEVEFYHPLRWYNLGRMNNRTHRKLLVVDGRIGFTGEVGIADQWEGRAESKDHWRDSHYQIEGPAVAQMQSAFADNWIKTRSEVLLGSNYFPALKATGNSLAHVFTSSRGEASECVRLMYLLSIASASGGGETIQSLLSAARKPTTGAWATSIAVVTLLIGATGVFVQLQDALNSIGSVRWKSRQGLRHFIKDRLLSFALIVSKGFRWIMALGRRTLYRTMSPPVR